MKKIALFLIAAAMSLSSYAQQQSWTADNGNGTYTNPLFYDEFSDPDLIRVGNDFYLAGTTMHCVPGVVILHSEDLVNWEFCSYAMPRFTLGEEFDLKNDKEAYGAGIWAPCIRYHNGTFYVFSNVNGHGLQVFISKDPKGPWQQKQFGSRVYDLSVLFDDDGKIYAVHGYDEVHLVEIKPDMSGVVDGTDKVIIPAGNAMGEGHHIYKINGKYIICSANYSPTGRMQCARADQPYGPYETTVISTDETMGYKAFPLVTNVPGRPLGEENFDFNIYFPPENNVACVPIHQGGIVDLPNGEWWGFSMMDFHSVGRTTCLSPITWKDGWPYYGLEGNLGRSPRTWVKPNVGNNVKPHAPYERNDDFSGTTLKPIWQFNHNPVEGKYKLAKGVFKINALPSPKGFMWAKNTLTQRCIGPVSETSVKINLKNLKDNDIVGLGLLNWPYATIGVERQNGKFTIIQHDQLRRKDSKADFSGTTIWLKAHGDYDENRAILSYSTDGKNFKNLGDSILLPYQLKTFQGIRLSLFCYSNSSKEGGYAEFDDFTVTQPFADRSNNLPIGKIITLKNLSSNLYLWASAHGMARENSEINNETKFEVIDRGTGKIALRCLSGKGYLSVSGIGLQGDLRISSQLTDDCNFMWQDYLFGHCMLMSLKNNKYVGINTSTGAPYSVDFAGSTPDLKNGAVFEWKIVE